MAQSIKLAGLSQREAVADAVYRCCLGLDNNDNALFESACVKDETMTFAGGPLDLQGWDAINNAMSILFTLVTSHFVTNVRTDLQDGADTAHFSAHVTAYHMRPDEAFKPEDTSFTAGSLWFIDLIKDETDGLWKIKNWVIKTLWMTGDVTIVHPNA